MISTHEWHALLSNQHQWIHKLLVDRLSKETLTEAAPATRSRALHPKPPSRHGSNCPASCPPMLPTTAMFNGAIKTCHLKLLLTSKKFLFLFRLYLIPPRCNQLRPLFLCRVPGNKAMRPIYVSSHSTITYCRRTVNQNLIEGLNRAVHVCNFKNTEKRQFSLLIALISRSS